MHHFLTFKNFPDTALKFGAYYFQSNLANIAIAQVWVLDTNFFSRLNVGSAYEGYHFYTQKAPREFLSCEGCGVKKQKGRF